MRHMVNFYYLTHFQNFRVCQVCQLSSAPSANYHVGFPVKYTFSFVEDSTYLRRVAFEVSKEFKEIWNFLNCLGALGHK